MRYLQKIFKWAILASSLLLLGLILSSCQPQVEEEHDYKVRVTVCYGQNMGGLYNWFDINYKIDSKTVTEEFLAEVKSYLESCGLTFSDGQAIWYSDQNLMSQFNSNSANWIDYDPSYSANTEKITYYYTHYLDIYTHVNEDVDSKISYFHLMDAEDKYLLTSSPFRVLLPTNATSADVQKYCNRVNNYPFSSVNCTFGKAIICEEGQTYKDGTEWLGTSSLQGKKFVYVLPSKFEDVGLYFVNVSGASTISSPYSDTFMTLDSLESVTAEEIGKKWAGGQYKTDKMVAWIWDKTANSGEGAWKNIEKSTLVAPYSDIKINLGGISVSYGAISENAIDYPIVIDMSLNLLAEPIYTGDVVSGYTISSSDVDTIISKVKDYGFTTDDNVVLYNGSSVYTVGSPLLINYGVTSIYVKVKENTNDCLTKMVSKDSEGTYYDMQISMIYHKTFSKSDYESIFGGGGNYYSFNLGSSCIMPSEIEKIVLLNEDGTESEVIVGSTEVWGKTLCIKFKHSYETYSFYAYNFIYGTGSFNESGDLESVSSGSWSAEQFYTSSYSLSLRNLVDQWIANGSNNTVENCKAYTKKPFVDDGWQDSLVPDSEDLPAFTDLYIVVSYN